MLDLVVSNGKVVTPDEILSDVDIGVAGGRVALIGPRRTLPEATRTIDVGGRYVLPGLIDPHTHPGNLRAFEDDIRSTSRSAAAGGVTTIFGTVKSTRLAPPFRSLTRPSDVVSFFNVFAAARESIERASVVDVGLSFMIATDEQAGEVPRYAQELGVRSFKFHPATVPGRWHRRIGHPVAADDGTIYLALEGVARAGALAMVHAENGQIARVLRARLQAAHAQGLRAWNDGSPDTGEASEILRMAFLCRAAGCRLYVAHITSRKGLDAVREARASGARVIVETCPQYLLHSIEDDPEKVLLKYSPPLRSSEDRDHLWKAVVDGEIQCIGSDHVPNRSRLKRGEGDIWSAISGSTGTETMLAAILTEGVHRRRIDMPRVARLLSTEAALAFGVHPRKGTITVGSDADLTVVDLDVERTVRIADLRSRAETDWSPLEGRVLKGWPVWTIRAGQVIAGDPSSQEISSGRYLSRS